MTYILGRRSRNELIGVHPDLDPEDEGHRHKFTGFQKDELQRSFLHTMRVLLGLKTKGVYPFREGIQCNWCKYTQACRRNHPPTRDREQQMRDAADYRSVLTKSTRSPDGR